MQATLLLGPAGSGKTFRCLAQVRAALGSSPDGLPLIFAAPKQATFQLERQLLGEGALAGYTRLHILSFERLAEFILTRLGLPFPKLLAEEGRLMVLRALLLRRREELKVFRASARLPGFAVHLSQLLRELQQHRLSVPRLRELAQRTGLPAVLREKLEDVALLLGGYSDWLRSNALQDADRLLDIAAEALEAHARTQAAAPLFAGLWLDGFAQLTPQELHLLASILPHCERATLAFCLDQARAEAESWLSPWSGVGQTFRECYQVLSAQEACAVCVEVLPRARDQGRFARQPALQHLEQVWAEPQPCAAALASSVQDAMRAAICTNPEEEAVVAAREILRHVRERQGRFRDCAVLLRRLEDYHDVLRRVFANYGIPFFIDRREPIAHHPLAELCRCAVRTVALGWRQEDWFGALKSGLAPISENEADQLETEALARGWSGGVWLKPISVPENQPLAERLERIRREVVPPFQNLAEKLASDPGGPTGGQLAAALRVLWSELDVERQLDQWSEVLRAGGSGLREGGTPDLHATAYEQMLSWLRNVERGFGAEQLELREWLPVLEAGLAGLSVGVVPPALDQVLIGGIDRSRNPDLQLALVLGVNEGVFPEAPQAAGLLTEAERATLEAANVRLSANPRALLGQERYFGYIACTRARQRLVVTCARHDRRGRLLNPSPFITRLQQIFPGLEVEQPGPSAGWRACEHPRELAPHLAQVSDVDARARMLEQLSAIPQVEAWLSQLRQLCEPDPKEGLSATAALALYGRDLLVSVTELERFAECPFRFFVHLGLRAQERRLYEADPRALGSFQHEALRQFHESVKGEGRRWRDLEPLEAGERMRRITEELGRTFNQALLETSGRNRFLALRLSTELAEFVEITVEWLRGQNQFDPVAAEASFGPQRALPAWELELSGGRKLMLAGKVDRIDLCQPSGERQAWCVVVDYKARERKIDPKLLASGVQLQLPAYLGLLARLKNPPAAFGVAALAPAGMFYINLKGQFEGGQHRNEVLDDAAARRMAFQHTGRFSAAALKHLDTRPQEPGVEKVGDQFRFRMTKKGNVHGACRDPMPPDQFERLLEQVERLLCDMGDRVLQGEASVAPYRHAGQTPCQRCEYGAVCRFDPWTRPYRALADPKGGGQP